MGKGRFVFMLSAFFLLSGLVFGQGPPIFVSTFDGHQILRVDGTSGATDLIYTDSISSPLFSPEDIVFGPDGKIYICDAPGNRIIRIDPDPYFPNPEVVYDQFSAESPNNPGGPEGPSFAANGDLFFNTRDNGSLNPHTGVWRIRLLAGDSDPFNVPVKVLEPLTTEGDGFGEGTAFTVAGDLLAVDRIGNRVMKSSQPTFGPPVELITGLSIPIGIAVNSADEIFVANFGTHEVLHFASDGSLLGPYVTFPPIPAVCEFECIFDSPVYMEFDASDNLYIVTAQTLEGEMGKVFRVAPPGGITNTDLLVDLSSVEGLNNNHAVGLAVSPTSTKTDLTFSVGGEEQVANFGTNTLRLTNQVNGTCTLTLTETETMPAEFLAQFGQPCVPFAGDRGFCQVVEGTAPDCFVGDTNGKWTWNFVGDPLSINPRVFRISDSNITDVATSYLPFAPLGDPDPGITIRIRGFSMLGTVQLSQVQAGNFCGFQSPQPGKVSKMGSTIPFAFQLTTGAGCTGSFITNAVAQLSVTKIPGNIGVNVVATSKRNLFRYDPLKNKYKFELSTKLSSLVGSTQKGLPPGMYTGIVLSNSFLGARMVDFSIKP